jgi:hypothetical protein
MGTVKRTKKKSLRTRNKREFFEAEPSSPAELIERMAKKVVRLRLSPAEKKEILERIRYIHEHLRRG